MRLVCQVQDRSNKFYRNLELAVKVQFAATDTALSPSLDAAILARIKFQIFEVQM
jgi:hypothetical protein